MFSMEQPTSEQCTCAHIGTTPDGRSTIAAWFPSIGGYAAPSLIVIGECCFDVYVWHNGDFPFAADSLGNEEIPRRLHISDGDDFIRFGKRLNELRNWAEKQPKTGNR